jgi:hypothetical protein
LFNSQSTTAKTKAVIAELRLMQAILPVNAAP